MIGVPGCIVFNKLEREGGSVRMPAVVILAYNVLGKWGVLIVFGGIGTLMTLLGLARVISPPPPCELIEAAPTGDGTRNV